MVFKRKKGVDEAYFYLGRHLRKRARNIGIIVFVLSFVVGFLVGAIVFYF